VLDWSPTSDPSGLFVGSSDSVREVIDLAVLYASLAGPLLLLGPTGVGKGLLAILIHRLSGRSGDFVVRTGGQLVDSLFHAQLFGTRRGAFTGADRDVPGAFELANKGTLFLDELPLWSQAAQSAVAACEAEVSHWEQVRETYRAHLKAMSLQVFPWRVTDSTPQTSQEVEVHLTAEVAAIQALLETNGLPVKQQVLGKVRQQLAGLAGVIDLWWQELRQDVQSQIVLTPMWANWVEAHLLPLMYWEQQVLRTRCPRRKAKLLEALEAVRAALEAHPLTAQLSPEVFVGWKAWAADYAKLFQRASSAVEGRNGYLSQMHHNHRGLPKRRYKVWSALHNFDCRASDGSTPASRFFRREFPDLFETVLAQIDELPRSRKRQPAIALSD